MPACRPGATRRALLLAIGVLAALSAAPAASARPLSRATRLHGVELTEYFPVPERWFVGEKVTTPGLAGPHRVDWLYSAMGISMEGDGVGLDGRQYHIDNLGAGGWINSALRPTTPGGSGWQGGSPVWRSGGYWRSAARTLTFPLDGGGWSNGIGTAAVAPPAGITFAPGPSRPLSFYRTIAVDPGLIPLGSRVYIAAYRHTPGHGWFTAVDTGGAIIGRHIDVYRSPPALASDTGNFFTGQTVAVYPPGTRLPHGAPLGINPAPSPTPPAPSPTPSAGPPTGGAAGAGRAPKFAGGAGAPS